SDDRMRRPDQTLRNFHRGRSRLVQHRQRIDLWISWPQRFRKIDRNSNALRDFGADRGHCADRWSRRRARYRIDQRNYWLYVAEIFALRRADGRRKPDLLRKALWIARARLGQTPRRIDRGHALGAVRQPARRVAFGRLATAAGNGVLADAPADRFVSGRTNCRDRSGRAPRTVGFAFRIYRERHDLVRDDALYGRSRALRSRRLHLHVEADRLGRAGRVEEN